MILSMITINYNNSVGLIMTLASIHQLQQRLGLDEAFKSVASQCCKVILHFKNAKK